MANVSDTHIDGCNKADIIWIDWVKSICIFFVIYNHVQMFTQLDGFFHIPYDPFFVNAFFFVSGYLLLSKFISLSECESSTRTNYLVGALLSILFKLVIPTILFSFIDYFLKIIVNGSTLNLWDLSFYALFRGSKWFTCALSIAEICLIVVLYVFRKINISGLIAVSILLFSLGSLFDFLNVEICGDGYAPWFYKSGLKATLLLTIGGGYYTVEKNIDRIFCKNSWFPLFLFLIVSLIAYFMCGITRFSLQERTDVMGLFMDIIMIVSLIQLCKHFPYIGAVKYISRHTIGFYFLSVIVPFASASIIQFLFQNSMLSFYISVLIAFCITWGLVFLLNQYLPFLFDLRKLNNKNKRI